jgi:hypothetical protein
MSCLILAFILAELTGSTVTTAESFMPVSPTDLGRSPHSASGDLTDEQRNEVQKRIDRNIRILKSAGRLPPRSMVTVSLAWPTIKARGTRDFYIGQIPNFVDHDPAFPGQVLDWNCGMRTYDRADGYNHRGTDIVSFPFPWKRMDNNEVYAVAAAAGVIIDKEDGNFDRNCGGPNPVNKVIVLHSDNSTAWYLHLKNGSVTQKSIGDTVAAGEYLGVPGSSGNSDVPHLHIELYDDQGRLQDPYQGACNTMNNFSWWAEQEPYRNSRINSLITASDLPVAAGCPQTETVNEKIVFQPLDPLVTITAVRDIRVGQDIQFSILRPDGSVFANWSFTSPNTLNATIRTAQWVVPGDGPTGEWTFKAVYNGQTYERTFYVGQPPNVAASGRITNLNGVGIPGAVITMSDAATGSKLIARSNAFGYYRVGDVVVGTKYSVQVSTKGRTFLSRSIMPGEELTDLDFFSLE